MPQSRPSMAVRPQSGPGDELTASDIRAAWLRSCRFDPASSPAQNANVGTCVELEPQPLVPAGSNRRDR